MIRASYIYIDEDKVTLIACTASIYQPGNKVQQVFVEHDSAHTSCLRLVLRLVSLRTDRLKALFLSMQHKAALSTWFPADGQLFYLKASAPLLSFPCSCPLPYTFPLSPPMVQF